MGCQRIEPVRNIPPNKQKHTDNKMQSIFFMEILLLDKPLAKLLRY